MMKMTRKEKRTKEGEINFLREFIIISNHFFKNFKKKLASVKEVRHTSYVTYEPELLLFVIIMKSVTGIISMNQMTRDFNTDNSIKNIAVVLGYEELEEIPHYDTINNFLKKLEPKELEKIRDYMIRELFRKRCLEKFRLLDKYWCIAIDGTQIASFDSKHYDNCLKKEYKNKETKEVEQTIYYNVVLEAKLIVGDMAFSVASEFIENLDEHYDKQDCEIKGAKRLAKKLKRKFPKLPICLLGDSLYSCEPFYQICEENKWEFVLRFKEGRAKSLWDEFQAIKKIECPKKDIHNFINGVPYNKRLLNIVETNEVIEDATKNFVFVTSLNITEKNLGSISSAGRSRWKIENQGFNNQKNIRYDITHSCCFDNQAMKNHYILIQIADILRQLLEHGSAAIKEIKAGIKEISSRILESFRREPLIPEDISNLKTHIKIRDL